MEENKIQLEIVTPERMVVTEAGVNEVVIPGEEGEFGVMPNHTPFLTSLRTGIVQVYKENILESLVVGKGFVEVTAKKVIILAQRAVKADEVVAGDAQQEEKDLDAKLKDLTPEDPDYDAIKDDYDFAAYKVKISA